MVKNIIRNIKKRHGTKRRGTKRRGTKRRGTKRHGTKRRGTKRRGTKRHGKRRHIRRAGRSSKIQRGGDNSLSKNISIITSHQGRMGCFLRTLMPDKPIKKFKNGAIVEIKFVPNAGKHVTTITLVYRGSLVDETVKKSYYVESDQGTLIGKLNLQQTLEKFNLTHADWLDMGENKTHIFYLVRHGDAKHNKKKREGKLNTEYDTPLTEDGEKQAQAAGVFLRKKIIDVEKARALILQAERNEATEEKGEAMEQRGDNENFVLDLKNIRYYTSDLHRTIQTMAYIMNELGTKNEAKMRVLPCNYEMNSKKPPCKKTIPWYAKLASPLWQRENETKLKSEESRKVEILVHGERVEYSVDWNLYNDNKGRSRCFKSRIPINFISTALKNANAWGGEIDKPIGWGEERGGEASWG